MNLCILKMNQYNNSKKEKDKINLFFSQLKLLNIKYKYFENIYFNFIIFIEFDNNYQLIKKLKLFIKYIIKYV